MAQQPPVAPAETAIARAMENFAKEVGYESIIATSIEYLQDCQELEPHIRAAVFLDKIKIGLYAGKGAIMNGIERELYDNSQLDQTNQNVLMLRQALLSRRDLLIQAHNILMGELKFLGGLISSKHIAPMERVEKKLDQILEGPDYPVGRRLMETAKADYERAAGIGTGTDNQ